MGGVPDALLTSSHLSVLPTNELSFRFPRTFYRCGDQGPDCWRGSPWAPWRGGDRADSLPLVALQGVLQAAELRLQPGPVPGHAVQLPPEGADVGLEDGLHVPLAAPLLLHELPLGLQQLVLLLQEPDLQPRTGCHRATGSLGTMAWREEINGRGAGTQFLLSLPTHRCQYANTDRLGLL